MDALSTILETTKLTSVVYNKLELSAPWGIDVAQDVNSQFWRLIKGNCSIGLPDDHIVELKEGDMVFVPHGSAHWIADSENSLRVSAPEFTRARLNGIPIFAGEVYKTILVGGHFQFDDTSLHPFLRDLPRIIHIEHFETENQQLLKQIGQLIFTELDREKPGTNLMLKCLSEITFIQIIRAYLEQVTPESSFLSALNDSRISKALKLMQDSPDYDWTLENLSEKVGMSRSVFFNQFKKNLLETPLSYLTNWRIRKAEELLRVDNRNISEIAMAVGYRSETAFNRIFKAKTGRTPAVYRRSR